ncbi:predicted protein [Sclerotinia sclerotiorum 1980 UF-70]|uniref:C2H2-type domain-containing protein n=1 Tax=Sclerotinia sclerotiorum (strain ATCC 18683 / 1980 / Ss-1) TaxID=665079 RepID=A7EAS0_SCLS1|nr:predicted protein [Sclerotinia sclerotiorum 1980 UF-70]EDN99548.1 predicted protein [Sclerotinia sclerotiorum 1980 UF-70]
MATFRWQMKDDIALLAWIDFCKQEKVEPSEGILNFMVLFHGVPSRDAVKEHLRVLWKRYNDQSDDSDQAMKLVGVLSKGSAYMTKLPGGMHEGIRILVDQHTSNATSLLITKVMKDIQTQKTATGQSKAHPLEEEGKRGVKRGKQVEKADQSPPPSKKARSSTAESSTKAIEEIAANRVEKSRSSVGKPATTSTKTKDGAARSNGKETIRTKPDAFSTDLGNQNTNENIWLKHLRALENKYNREIAQMQELWQAEAEKLSMREAEAQMTIRDLRAELKHLDEARKARQDEGRKTQEEDANVSRETRQFEDLEEICRLAKENREMHKFATFADMNSSGSLHLGHDTADDAMDQIQFGLSSISYHCSTTGLLFPRVFAISGDLRNLTLSAFSSDIETTIGRNDVQTILKKFDAHTCIRVLVLAALRDWVFMSRFPNLASSNPHILSSYRHIISSLDGKDKLYRLDMAAHRTIVEGKRFKEKSIHRRAMDLADRFSNAVAPLFAATLDSVGDGLFHTWGEHTEFCKDRRAHLQEIFQAALTLKADSVVTKYRYEFALYLVGITFVGDTSDLKESEKPKNGDNWILASFHVYDPIIVGNTNETTLVQTENFVKASGKIAEAKYRSCTECGECGRRFSRASALRKHQKAEHSEYRASRIGEQIIEQAHTQPQVSATVDRESGRYHEEILAPVARNFSPTHQRTDHNPGNQLVEVQQASSAIAPQDRPAKFCRNELEQRIVESETVHAEARCELCGKLFSNRDSLRHHNKNSRVTVKSVLYGKRRYKKTPRNEAEDSDADDILSPSEITKTARAQRRRYTRSSDRAEARMTNSQESPVRRGARRSKTPVIEE